MKVILNILRYMAIYFVAFVLLVFAVTKFMGTQFQIQQYVQYLPLREVAPFWQAWAFFGKSYPYGFFLGLAELFAALFMLFDRTRLAGLLLAFGILLNVVIVDIEFEVYSALGHASLELVLVILLLTGYLKDLKTFFWDMGGRFNRAVTSVNKWSLIIPTAFATVILIASFIFFWWVPSTYNNKFMGAYEITHFSVGNDTIPPARGKYSEKPMLFIEFSGLCAFSADNRFLRGRYSLNGDSIKIKLDNSILFDIELLKGKIDWQQNTITGIAHSEPVVIKLERVNDK